MRRRNKPTEGGGRVCSAPLLQSADAWRSSADEGTLLPEATRAEGDVAQYYQKLAGDVGSTELNPGGTEL
jgi:hypothetical protein